LWDTVQTCIAPTNGTATCSAVTGCGHSCYNGYCESGNSCVSPNGNDINNCGSCGNVCAKSDVQHATSVTCNSGKCEALFCEECYHEYEGACEGESKCHCGSHDTMCSDGQVCARINNRFQCITNSGPIAYPMCSVMEDDCK
jgi:hypothetical protein